MKVKTLYGEYEVSLEVARYTNGNLAIELNDAEDGMPFARITTNTGDVFKSSNNGVTEYALIDTNNCPWAEDFIRTYHLGSEVGATIPSGFCNYPIWEMNMDALKFYSHESNGYYPITIEVTCTKQLYIQADSEEEALGLAYENYYSGEPDFVVPDGWCYGRDDFIVEKGE